MGDFNGWNETATPMTRDAFGTWEAHVRFFGFLGFSVLGVWGFGGSHFVFFLVCLFACLLWDLWFLALL